MALASPTGTGAISLIRISGPESISIVDNIFDGIEKIKLADLEENKVQLGYIMDSKRTIDKVLVTVFRNPKSYTGEDLVEISCHGSIFIQESIIQLLLNFDCRVAKPGEFTMRSFLNGKMDLSQAESVADLISSNSEASHKLAMNQMRGGFKSDINNLRTKLVNFASLIELELDFSQEDVEFANMKELNKLLNEISSSLKKLIDSFKTGNVIKNGIPIAIVGEPNTGKSTLLNLISLVDRPTTGNIIINGKKIIFSDPDYNDTLRANKIGIIYQNYNLLPDFNAFENILLSKLVSENNEVVAKKEAIYYLKKVGLYNRMNNFPSQLSGGESQRIAIARALIKSPEIIVADEPTGSLDNKNAKEIFKLFLKLKNKKRVIIFATHNMYFAKMADYTLHIKNGNIKLFNARKSR